MTASNSHILEEIRLSIQGTHTAFQYKVEQVVVGSQSAIGLQA